MGEPCTPEALLEAVRELRVAEPDLGFKPLLAKLRQHQPDLGAATKEVREALLARKAEIEAAKAAAAAPPAADEGGAPPNVALSLACIGCFRLPSDMEDEREKHPICDMCLDQKLPTTYLCGVNCPANPGVWQLHGAFHKQLKQRKKNSEDGGATQRQIHEVAELEARLSAQSGDEYQALLAEGGRYASKADWRKAARTCREAIALSPDRPTAYANLGAALLNSGHIVEAAQRLLEARERYPVGEQQWAETTAAIFNLLRKRECDEVAKPKWWNDEELKALSARVVRAAPDWEGSIRMRAAVLGGVGSDFWGGAGPRSAVELREAAVHYERAGALCDAPVVTANFVDLARRCRSQAEALRAHLEGPRAAVLVGAVYHY